LALIWWLNKFIPFLVAISFLGKNKKKKNRFVLKQFQSVIENFYRISDINTL